ncbi:MAG: hypothetical protein ABR861_07675 [Terriglobales bacterium]|jgi:hypothetical protein
MRRVDCRNLVGWGLEHRTLQSIRAIGVDEIQYAKGHKYLTLTRRGLFTSVAASPTWWTKSIAC